VLLAENDRSNREGTPDKHRAVASEAGPVGAISFSAQGATDDNGSARSPAQAIDLQDQRRPSTARCPFTSPDGRRCRATPQRLAGWCVFHDPARTEQVAAARRLGGLHRRRAQSASDPIEVGRLDNPDGPGRLIEIATSDALGSEPSLARALTLVKIALAATNVRSAINHEARLALLEAGQRGAVLVSKEPQGKANDDDRRLPELDG
jgi:hypothetical protein